LLRKFFFYKTCFLLLAAADEFGFFVENFIFAVDVADQASQSANQLAIFVVNIFGSVVDATSGLIDIDLLSLKEVGIYASVFASGSVFERFFEAGGHVVAEFYTAAGGEAEGKSCEKNSQ